jgi:hypothetical protein
MRKVADLVVALVDELSSMLVDLSFVEESASGPTTPAHPVGGFVHVGDVSGLLESVGARQPSEPRADDHDRWWGCSAGGWRQPSEGG